MAVVSVKLGRRRNSGVLVQTKIKAALKSEGLKESTGVTALVTGAFPGRAARPRRPVKPETFSDQWHVLVFILTRRSSTSSSGLLTSLPDKRQIPDNPSRTNGYLSRVFPPWDVLSSLD